MLTSSVIWDAANQAYDELFSGGAEFRGTVSNTRRCPEHGTQIGWYAMGLVIQDGGKPYSRAADSRADALAYLGDAYSDGVRFVDVRPAYDVRRTAQAAGD